MVSHSSIDLSGRSLDPGNKSGNKRVPVASTSHSTLEKPASRAHCPGFACLSLVSVFVSLTDTGRISDNRDAFPTVLEAEKFRIKTDSMSSTCLTGGTSPCILTNAGTVEGAL